MIVTYALIGICALYVLEYLFFSYGIRKARRRRETQETKGDFPFVSVVVAARNEEKRIDLCLDALIAQDYPHDRFEVIIVDDESEDGTGRVVREVMASGSTPIRLMTTVPEPGSLHGKSRALAQGIDATSGEIIMMTDADCQPTPTWISAVVGYMNDGADVVAGMTVVRGSSLFERLQMLDWLHLQAIAAASMAFRSPVGAVGNNMAFRRSAYDAIGGYRKLPFSITEDFTLFLALCRAGFTIAYPCDRTLSVSTLACENLTEVLRQKHRWGRGGMESTPHGYSILVVAFFMLVALCAAPFVSPAAWLGVWGVKFVADLILLLPVFRELGIRGAGRTFLPFQFYFLAQALVVPVMIINPNVSWKGRVFQTVRPGVEGER